MRGQTPSETVRIEAFSDGVFAIAITLLILNIRPPDPADNAPLLPRLVKLWPSYFAFFISFLTIGIMWINHHRLFTLISRSDHWLLILNTALLLGVCFVPFPTAVVALNLSHPDEDVAAAVYSGMFVIIAILFNLLWRYAATGGRLLSEDVDEAAVAAQTKQYSFGPFFYLVAFGLVWISPILSIIANLLFALFFALPPKSLYKVMEKSDG